MTVRIRRVPAFVLLLVASFAMFAFSAGCDDDDPVQPVPTGTVQVQLDHQVGTTKAPLTFDSIQFTNAAGNNYGVSSLLYFISDVTLTRGDGSSFSLNGTNAVHYRDARDDATRTHELSGVPAGTYTGVSFTFGIEGNKNVDGFLPATQENLNMEWPMPPMEGYHYMKLEGTWSNDPPGYATHTGPSGGNHRQITVTLPGSGFTLEEDGTVQVQVLMDLNEWYDGPNMLDLADFAGGIMMNQTIQQQLSENGASVFSLGGITEIGID